jgi:formate dehydrogenase subunit beta
VWDSNCGINLANYLTNRKEKIAIFAKGCDSPEYRYPHYGKQDQARSGGHIIGVPCTGDDRQTQNRPGGR